MPTIVTKTIGTASRNYSTLASWESAEQGDLVAADEIRVGECYKDSQFTAGVTIAGSTVDSTRYMSLTVAAADRHTGTKGTGAQVQASVGFAGLIVLTNNFTHLSWLEIGNTNANGRAVSTTGTNTDIGELIIYDGDSGIETVASTPGIIRNCIIYGFTLFGLSAADGKVYNCSILGGTGTGGIQRRAFSTADVRNCAVCGNSVTDYSTLAGGSWGSSTNNLSSDTTAPGTSPQTSKSATNQWINITGGSENLHLKSSADCVNNGSNLTSTFTNDIDNQTRGASGSWDIGADEIFGVVFRRTLSPLGVKTGKRQLIGA